MSARHVINPETTLGGMAEKCDGDTVIEHIIHEIILLITVYRDHCEIFAPPFEEFIYGGFLVGSYVEPEGMLPAGLYQGLQQAFRTYQMKTADKAALYAAVEKINRLTGTYKIKGIALGLETYLNFFHNLLFRNH